MDAGRGKRSENGDLKDRISELHDSLKLNILERLPLTDAVRTNLLSKKWRHSWTRVGQLVFDERVLFDHFKGLTQKRFCRIIERILLLHEGSLTKLVLNIPQNYKSKTLYTNGLFIYLSRKGVQKLEINYQLSLGGSYFYLPSYFFHCGRLTHLVLSAHVLRPPANFQGFNNLVSLELNRIAIKCCKLAMLISRCPLLERLSLIGLFGFFSEPLDIIAPNLRLLQFEDYISGMLILNNVAKLTIVSLRWLEDVRVQHKNAYSSLKLLCSLSRIEDLSFSLPLLEPFVGGCPNHLENKFVALRTLTLCHVNICSRDDISFTFCLLRSSPSLKTLNIYMHYTSPTSRVDGAAAEDLEAEGRKENNFNKLLKVKIAGITGLRCEIMLVKTMLSSCPLIETLVIEPSKNILIEASNEMAWELNRCRRLSTLVEVVYSRPRSKVVYI